MPPAHDTAAPQLRIRLLTRQLVGELVASLGRSPTITARLQLRDERDARQRVAAPVADIAIIAGGDR